MYTQGVFLPWETKGEDAVVQSKGNIFWRHSFVPAYECVQCIVGENSAWETFFLWDMRRFLNVSWVGTAGAEVQFPSFENPELIN